MRSSITEHVSNDEWTAAMERMDRRRVALARREKLVDIFYSAIIGLCLGALLAVLLSGAGAQ